MKWCTPVGVLISVFSAVVIVGAQATGPSVELEAAKALYRDARFTEAAAKLHEITVALKPQAHVPEARDLLADAYLYLALCHVALDSPSAAKQAFKDLLRLEPERRLDPAVYAPKVVEIFSEALDDLPGLGADADPAGAETEAAVEKKGGSKTLPILLGVGAAAGVAVAIGGGGSGDSSSTSSARGSTTPAPVPTPTQELPGDEVFTIAGMNPPIGSRFSLSAVSVATIDLFVTFGSSRFSVDVALDDNVPVPTPETDCYVHKWSDFVEPGSSVPVSVTVDLTPLAEICNLPYGFRWHLDLYAFGQSDRFANLQTQAVYTIDP